MSSRRSPALRLIAARWDDMVLLDVKEWIVWRVIARVIEDRKCALKLTDVRIE